MDPVTALIEQKRKKLELQAQQRKDLQLDWVEHELRRQLKDIYTEAELREHAERQQAQVATAVQPEQPHKRRWRSPLRRRSSMSNRTLRRHRNKRGAASGGLYVLLGMALLVVVGVVALAQ